MTAVPIGRLVWKLNAVQIVLQPRRTAEELRRDLAAAKRYADQ
jgi:hypothetical protein